MSNPKNTTSGWGSVNAEDLFKIATRLGGFDAKELMLEIHRQQGGRDARVNERTVLAAIDKVYRRAAEEERKLAARTQEVFVEVVRIEKASGPLPFDNSFHAVECAARINKPCSCDL